MQGFPKSIDWETAERIYLMYSAPYGTGQSLERIAERGGFGWKEVEYIAKEYISVHGTASLSRLVKEVQS